MRNAARKLAVMASVVVGLYCSAAQAQQNSLFGQSGPSSGAAGLGTATNGATNGTFPSSQFPTTQFGATNAGGAAGQAGAAGAAGAQQGIVGQRNTNFVGANATTARTGTTGQAGMNNRQGQNRNSNRRTTANQNQSSGQTGNTNQQARAVRPQMQVDFERPPKTEEATQQSVEQNFSNLAKRDQFKGLAFEFDGTTLVLRGEVATARDAKLAVNLARLEPGVRKVQSELTVAAAPAADSQ